MSIISLESFHHTITHRHRPSPRTLVDGEKFTQHSGGRVETLDNKRVMCMHQFAKQSGGHIACLDYGEHRSRFGVAGLVSCVDCICEQIHKEDPGRPLHCVVFCFFTISASYVEL